MKQTVNMNWHTIKNEEREKCKFCGQVEDKPCKSEKESDNCPNSFYEEDHSPTGHGDICMSDADPGL